MSNTYPFTEAHAIARLDFSIALRNDLTGDEKGDLASAFQAHLTQFERQDIDDKEEAGEAFIAFDLKDQDGDVTESVHIHGNYVHVVWSEYRGWSYSRDSALQYLQPVLTLVRDGRLKLSSVGLAYNDVFFNDSLESYDANDVLRSDCRYLAPFVHSAGKRWHHWLAWGSEASDELALVTRSTLRVDASVTKPEDDSDPSHVTVIVHVQNIRWADDNALASPSNEDVQAAWDHAHGANNALMHEMITDDMLERIGLKEGSSERLLQR